MAVRPESAVRPFLFDRQFRSEGDRPDGRSKPSAPPAAVETVFHQADLDRARAEGLAEGRRAARAEAMASDQRKLVQSGEALVRQLEALATGAAEARQQAIEDAVAVAAAITRKILPAFCRREGTGEIEALVQSLLGRLQDEPRLTVRLNPHRLQEIDERLAVLTERSGYTGLLRTTADADVADADCRVEWAAGGAVRRTAEVWREIDAILARTLPVDRWTAEGPAASTIPAAVGGPSSGAEEEDHG
jgi:flagellar assembly protein FliH